MVHKIIPISIGFVALNNLDKSRHLKMNNATSRGTFLVTEKNRIVFLTVDLIFGPLNIITEESICLDNVTGFIENRNLF